MDTDQTDDLGRRVARYAALADPTRLQMVDLLALGDLSVSEVGGLLEVPSNLLAHHLKALESAGLVHRRRSEGDGRRSYLSLAGDAIALAGGAEVAQAARVVFVCTANTARSHLAAALWRRVSPVAAVSAGTEPGERIAPKAVKAAQRHGLTLPEVAPQDLGDVVRDGDLVVTVCDRAHEQLAGRGWTHWSIPDPVRVGTVRAFDTAYEDIAARVDTLAPRLTKAS